MLIKTLRFMLIVITAVSLLTLVHVVNAKPNTVVLPTTTEQLVAYKRGYCNQIHFKLTERLPTTNISNTLLPYFNQGGNDAFDDIRNMSKRDMRLTYITNSCVKD